MSRASSSLSFVVSAQLLLLVVGCATPEPHPKPVERSAAPPDTHVGTLAVTIRLDDETTPAVSPRGDVVMGWLTAAEREAMKTEGLSAQVLSDLISRFVVVKNQDLSHGPLTQALDVPPGDVVPFAVLDVTNNWWFAFMGGPDRPGDWLGFADDARTVHPNTTTSSTVTLRPLSPHPVVERCLGERLELVIVEETAVRGRDDNDTRRRLCVYLPESYRAATTRRYPVVFLFSGIFGTDTARLRGKSHTGHVVDSLSKDIGREAILVGVDTSTRAGSTYLVDNAQQGAFETFMTTSVVNAIDERYRTIASADARAVVGQSTGGFNAVSLAVRHPDVFSVVGASAPDALDFPSWFLDDDGASFRPWVLSWIRLEDQAGGPGQMVSYASDFSPSDDERGFTWPVDLENGAIVDDVWARWMAQSPAAQLQIPARREAVRRHLSGRIFISVSEGDEFGLYKPAALFSAELDAAGVPHRFESPPGGHFDGFAERFLSILRFTLETLPAAHD